MKVNIEEAKKILDDLVFNNELVKPLVEKGYVLPESTIENDYMVKGQTAIIYHYKYFGGDYITQCRLLNQDDSEYLFGWSGEDALVKAAGNAIYELSLKADPEKEAEFNRRQYEYYSSFYDGNHYNGD